MERRGRAGMLAWAAAAWAAAIWAGWASVCAAGSPAGPLEVLAEAYPDAEVAQDSVFLTAAQRARAEALAGAKIESELLHRYRVLRDGGEVVTAYTDAHRVRTLPETLLVAVDPAGRVGRVEVLVFREPLEYLPDPRWYRQMEGMALSDRLQLKAGVDGITGATLSTRAAVQAVRRILALHQVLAGGPDR